MGPISKYVELNFGGIISPKAGQTILQMASSREREIVVVNCSTLFFAKMYNTFFLHQF